MQVSEPFTRRFRFPVKLVSSVLLTEMKLWAKGIGADRRELSGEKGEINLIQTQH